MVEDNKSVSALKAMFEQGSKSEVPAFKPKSKVEGKPAEAKPGKVDTSWLTQGS